MTSCAATLREERFDKWGTWASAACAVHCMVSPLLFLGLPVFAKYWAHPASHALMALLVVPLALTVILRGYRLHRRRWVALSATAGIALILVGSGLPYFESGQVSAAVSESSPESVETNSAATSGSDACTNCCPSVITDAEGSKSLQIPAASVVTVLGSAFLVAAHLGNRRGCASCQSTTADEAG